MNRLFVVIFLFISNFLTNKLVVGNVLVYTLNGSVYLAEYESNSALFGPSLPSMGYRVLAVAGEPIDGCSALNPPPKEPEFEDLPPDTKFTVNYAVIVARGGINCTFEQKVRNAQNAGFHAAIVHNVDSDELQRMSAKNAADIRIPSIFVGAHDGLKLINEFNYMNDVYLLLNDDMPFDINTHLILPFSIVVGLCFLIMIGFMIVRCVREQRRMRRHRLPSSMLKTIPVIKFNKTLTYEMCAICLDDYQEGERLRVLPCDHAYHCKCIDEWLTKNRRVCPICKRKVLPKRPPRHGTQQNRNRLDQQQQGQQQQRQQQQQRRRQHHQQRSSDESMSDSEADDSTPLLNPVENSSNSQNHGTFRQVSAGNMDATSGGIHRSMLQQRVNPFDRSPNLQESILGEQTNLSAWQRFLRVFNHRRNQQNDSSQNSIDNYYNDGSSTAIIDVSGSSDGHMSGGSLFFNDISSRRMNTRVDGGGGGGSIGCGGCDNVSTISIHGVDGATGGDGSGGISGGGGGPSAASSSNNLLNTNLSGSFKDSDDDDLPQVSIYEPINTATAATITNNNNKPTATIDSDNVEGLNMIQNRSINLNPQNLVPSSSSTSTTSSSQGRLGVAAIPNMNFKQSASSSSSAGPSIQQSSTSRSHTSSSPTPSANSDAFNV